MINNNKLKEEITKIKKKKVIQKSNDKYQKIQKNKIFFYFEQQQ